MPDTETTITVKLETPSIAWGLIVIGLAIAGPMTCAHDSRCAKWIDAAPTVQERIDRTAQCEAEEAAR